MKKLLCSTAVVLCLVLQLIQETKASIADCVPRKTVKYQSGNVNTFMKEGLSNVSTLLVNEETNTLFVGGRDAVFALDFNNVSREIARQSNTCSGSLSCLVCCRDTQKPSFVNMEIVHESESNADGDDDKIYVFFTETAAEFDFCDKLLVSRIAHICRSDLGGKHMLQRRASFLKSRLSCSIPELNFHFNIVQDIFLLRRRKWQDSIFYGIFPQPWGRLDISAVCAYSVKKFSKGRYKGPVAVDHPPVKRMVCRGEVPVPPPGACTDNFARSMGDDTSSDSPDKVLQFVRDHPLMDNSVNPVGNRPVLLKRGSNCTRIAVDRPTGLGEQTYDVMFPGTDDGYLHKAFSCDGEVFLVEELQLFLSPEPVQSLQLSSEKVELLSLHMESACCNSLPQACSSVVFWL
ncbi:LOW QUALITY PROTEIN: semaphorin-4D-like [Leptosomus discolor]